MHSNCSWASKSPLGKVFRIARTIYFRTTLTRPTNQACITCNSNNRGGDSQQDLQKACSAWEEGGHGNNAASNRERGENRREDEALRGWWRDGEESRLRCLPVSADPAPGNSLFRSPSRSLRSRVGPFWHYDRSSRNLSRRCGTLYSVRFVWMWMCIFHPYVHHSVFIVYKLDYSILGWIWGNAHPEPSNLYIFFILFILL